MRGRFMLPPDLGAKVRFPPVATDAAPRTNEQNGLSDDFLLRWQMTSYFRERL
jgi:hypothetical protein